MSTASSFGARLMRRWPILFAMSEAVGMGLQAIRAYKLRAGLTILGVVMGVMTVTGMSAIVAGLNRSMAQQVESLGSSVVFIRPWRPGENPSAEQQRRRKGLTMAEVEAIARKPAIRSIAALELVQADLIKAGNYKLKDAQVVGVSASYADVHDVYVEKGRFFSETDTARVAHVTVIGASVADALFPFVDPVGQEISIDGRRFRVIGVLVRLGKFLFFDRDNLVLVPPSSVKKDPRFDFLFADFKPVSPERIDDAMEEAREAIRRVRRLEYLDEDTFAIFSQDTFTQLYQSLTGGIYLVMIAISSIGLVVGGVGVMNIMLVSVTERTREIGIRKALGAKRRDILWQFLTEAMTLTALGGDHRHRHRRRPGAPHQRLLTIPGGGAGAVGGDRVRGLDRRRADVRPLARVEGGLPGPRRGPPLRVRARRRAAYFVSFFLLTGPGLRPIVVGKVHRLKGLGPQAAGGFRVSADAPGACFRGVANGKEAAGGRGRARGRGVLRKRRVRAGELLGRARIRELHGVRERRVGDVQRIEVHVDRADSEQPRLPAELALHAGHRQLVGEQRHVHHHRDPDDGADRHPHGYGHGDDRRDGHPHEHRHRDGAHGRHGDAHGDRDRDDGATATRTATATATRTATATATTGTGSNNAYQAAYWTQNNDPCTNSGAPGSGEEWNPIGACSGQAAWNAWPRPTTAARRSAARAAARTRRRPRPRRPSAPRPRALRRAPPRPRRPRRRRPPARTARCVASGSSATGTTSTTARAASS